MKRRSIRELMEELKIPENSERLVRYLIKEYMRRYPEVKTYMDKNGWVETDDSEIVERLRSLYMDMLVIPLGC